MSARAADDYVRVGINVFGRFSDGQVAACVSRVAFTGSVTSSVCCNAVPTRPP